MKKILSVLAVMLAAFFVVGCSSKPKVPEKTPAQLKADSIAKVKKDSVAKIANFKKTGIGYLERYLKNQCSSDPSVGKVLKTKDRILSDSIYFGQAKVLIKNRYGANEQYSDLWFCAVRPKDKKVGDHFIAWADEEYCQRGLDAMLGKDKTCIPIIVPQPEDYSKLIRVICNSDGFTIANFCDGEDFGF